jgi:hypothetical protein
MSTEEMNRVLSEILENPQLALPKMTPDVMPQFPPLTQDEINQIFAGIPQQPTISQDEVNRIFESVPSNNLTTEEMNRIFDSIPQQTPVSEEEMNRIFNNIQQQSGVSPVAMNPVPQTTDLSSFGTMPTY